MHYVCVKVAIQHQDITVPLRERETGMWEWEQGSKAPAIKRYSLKETSQGQEATASEEEEEIKYLQQKWSACTVSAIYIYS